MTGKEAEQLEDLDIKSKISGHYYKNMRYFQDGMTRANVCVLKIHCRKNLTWKL